MSKFTCLVLCAVVVSLNSAFAGKEEMIAFRDFLKPIIATCSKKHGVTDDEIVKAKETNTVQSMNPCFLACVFKEMEILNDKGEFDVDTSMTRLKQYVKNDDEYAKCAEIGKQCLSVNDVAVSDGEAGCERAALLSACFIEHNAMLI